MYRYLFNKRIKHTYHKLILEDFERYGFSYFQDEANASEWGRYAFKDWLAKLKKENENQFFIQNERYLKSSLQAIKWYCGYRYENVNNLLRFNLNNGLENISLEIISYLDQEFNFVKLQEGIVVIRWICKNAFLQNYGIVNPGEEITDKAFLSTSLLLNYKDELEYGVRDIEKYVLLIIKIPPGKSCLYVEPISERSNEQEVLIPRNSILRIEKSYTVLFRKAIFLCSVA